MSASLISNCTFHFNATASLRICSCIMDILNYFICSHNTLYTFVVLHCKKGNFIYSGIPRESSQYYKIAVLKLKRIATLINLYAIICVALNVGMYSLKIMPQAKQRQMFLPQEDANY